MGRWAWWPAGLGQYSGSSMTLVARHKAQTPEDLMMLALQYRQIGSPVSCAFRWNRLVKRFMAIPRLGYQSDRSLRRPKLASLVRASTSSAFSGVWLLAGRSRYPVVS